MSTEAWQQVLQAARGQLPGGAESDARRISALDAFNATGFPTRRLEAWKYTDLKPLADADFQLLPAEPGNAAREALRARIDAATASLGGSRLVFVDGHYDSALSRQPRDAAAKPAIVVSDLASAWPRFEQRRTQRQPSAGHPLALLNTAFAREGAWIEIPAGVRADEPVQLVLAASGTPGLAPQPRIVIELGEGAAANVVLQFLDANDAAGWINVVTEISLARGAQLGLQRLQEHGREQFHTSLTTATLAADSELRLATVDLGARLVRHDIEVSLAEPGAAAELLGFFLATDAQHVDNQVRIDHVAPATRSDETFRGIAGSRSRGVFNGKVVVHAGAAKIDARQRSDNLLLSDDAEIDTKPELEIYADDVRCSHGATIGELDEQQLWYLRSRGIGAAQARQMLTFAFANVVLERVPFAALREQMASRVAERLGFEAGVHRPW
jgi:Fe-S cluster assembly protein SufD